MKNRHFVLFVLLTPALLSAQPLNVEGKRFSWLDRIEVPIVTTTIALDGWTTARNITPQYHEWNPVVSPFIKSDAGCAGAAALGISSVISGNYLLRGHPKLKHVFNWSIEAGEVWAVSRNLYIHRPR